MTLRYIFHSGFLLETSQCILVFDYWMDPADAIPFTAPKTVDAAKCISCMKCVSVCPTGARGIGVIMNFLATQGLKKVCATRKENELYI